MELRSEHIIIMSNFTQIMQTHILDITQMFNKCLIWPQCLKYVEKILIFDCAGQKSDEIVAHGKHWLSRHFEVMPGEGGVSNYAFPVPWPGRRDHCSIQVPRWWMLTMAWWWYLGKTSHNKNRYLSGIAQITSPPHPLPPIWASCTTFFGRKKRRFCTYYRTK